MAWKRGTISSTSKDRQKDIDTDQYTYTVVVWTFLVKFVRQRAKVKSIRVGWTVSKHPIYWFLNRIWTKRTCSTLFDFFKNSLFHKFYIIYFNWSHEKSMNLIHLIQEFNCLTTIPISVLQFIPQLLNILTEKSFRL